MVGAIYFVIIVLANTVGAIAGMGGGVIIKPLFDTLAFHSVAEISFFSSVAVFTMAIVSTLRQLKNGIHIDGKEIVFLAIGSIIGGIGGNALFKGLLDRLMNDALVQLIQIALTIVTLIFAFVYARYDLTHYHLRGLSWRLLAGLLLGFLASFLGIGGGPINVSLLILLFDMPIKQATVYSIATIFFSQCAKLITIATTTGFAAYDNAILVYIIPAAVIGGLLGARFSHVLSEAQVNRVFQIVVLLVIAINGYNAYRIFA